MEPTCSSRAKEELPDSGSFQEGHRESQGRDCCFESKEWNLGIDWGEHSYCWCHSIHAAQGLKELMDDWGQMKNNILTGLVDLNEHQKSICSELTRTKRQIILLKITSFSIGCISSAMILGGTILMSLKLHI